MKSSERVTNGPKISKNFFSKRQIEIIRLICRQYSSQQIGKKLGISKRTVEGHREDIYKKAKAKNAIGLVLYALKHRMYKI